MARDGATTRSGREARKTGPGLRARLALGLLGALVLLADGTGPGPLPVSGVVDRTGETRRSAPCGEVDCGGQASRLEAVLGAAVSFPAPRFERVGAGDPPSSCRGRARAWDWIASRLHAEVHAVIRNFGPSAWRQRNGHVSDRPLIFTLPARGPPATA